MRSRLAVVVTITACVLFALAPAASAQLIDQVPDIGDIGGGDTGGTGDDGDGSSNNGGGGLTDPIGEIIDVLDPEPDENPNQGNPDPVKEIVNKVEETFGGTKDEVDKVADDPSGYVGGVTKGTEPAPKTRERSGKLDGKKKRSGTSDRSAGPTGGDLFGDRNPVYRPGVAVTIDNEAKKNVRLVSTMATEITPDEGEGFVSEVIHQIGRVAAEAVQQAAFPISLALLVGAFLMVQNRVDRRDPKLALAPIDSDQELLTFS